MHTTHGVPSNDLGAGDAAESKPVRSPSPRGAHTPMGKTDNTNIK